MSNLPPVRLLWCSWPQPSSGGRAAPAEHAEVLSFPTAPQPQVVLSHSGCAWRLDWQRVFWGELQRSDGWQGAEMRGFRVQFELEACVSGTFTFESDGPFRIDRQSGASRAGTELCSSGAGELSMLRGERFRITQWHEHGDWFWSIREDRDVVSEGEQWLGNQLTRVGRDVARGDGPPVKLFTSGASPYRVALTLYSLVLRGFTPGRIYLYGEHQWPDRARAIIERYLPFVTIVRTGEALENIRSAGGRALVRAARDCWWVNKALMALVQPPLAACCVDDDVFFLGNVADALDEFGRHDLVFAADTDYSGVYAPLWGRESVRTSPTARFNAGLFWVRAPEATERTLDFASRIDPYLASPIGWEQGLLATLYADRPALALPTQTYFFPVFDGLPNGVLGYDYAGNPCGFETIHFGGLLNKPGDLESLFLARSVLPELPEADSLCDSAGSRSGDLEAARRGRIS